MGRIIPYIMDNKKCLKPPTRICSNYTLNLSNACLNYIVDQYHDPKSGCYHVLVPQKNISKIKQESAVGSIKSAAVMAIVNPLVAIHCRCTTPSKLANVGMVCWWLNHPPPKYANGNLNRSGEHKKINPSASDAMTFSTSHQQLVQLVD